MSGVPEFLAFGDLGVDVVARVDRLPRPDDKLWLEPRGEYAGGMMGNAAVAAASLGVSAGVVGLVGSDERGGFVLAALRARGVDTRFSAQVDAPTFWTLALTTPSGDRALLQSATPAFGVDWDGFDYGVLAQTRWVHTTAEQGDAVGNLLRRAREAGATTSLDIEFPFVLRADLGDLLGHVDVAMLNGAAAEALGGVVAAARSCRDRGAGTVLVTMGRRGAFLLDRSGRDREVPAIPVDAVDTNGAGDAFAGGYAAGILKGLDERETAELAVVVAGLSTTALGGHGPEQAVTEIAAVAKAHGYDWWDRL